MFRVVILATALSAFCLASHAAAQIGTPPQKQHVEAEQKLKLSMAKTFLIQGGRAGDECALLVGFTERRVVLPGNALLAVEPTFVMARGRFDAKGEFRFDYEELLQKATKPFQVSIQAISIDARTRTFATSNVVGFGILND